MTKIGARNIQGKVFNVGSQKKSMSNSKHNRNEIERRTKIGKQLTKKSPTVGIVKVERKEEANIKLD